MPPDMAISMRHSKLKASEAALLMGELKKPSWESRNEGIHERVSFEDAIWGFDLAGGSFYKTPLRVVGVKADSRAEKAGIRKGDMLLRINDIDTSTLSIQEAHKIIIESGIHLKIAVTAPEDEEDAYFCYQDEIDAGYDSEEERRLEEEKVKKRQVHAKVSSYWSLQWPWVSKRRIIYRESNCFMVPSKYEGKHSDKFTERPMIRTEDDIVLHSKKSEKDDLTNKSMVTQGVIDTEAPVINAPEPMVNGIPNTENVITNGDIAHEVIQNGVSEETDKISEQEENSMKLSEMEVSESDSKNNSEMESVQNNSEVGEEKDDEVINQVLDNHVDMSVSEEDTILNGILSDSEAHSLDNSEAMDER